MLTRSIGRSGENVMKHLKENILPSIQNLNLSAEEVAKVNAPVLTIHGTRDRQAPYGGGREWVLMLPNARLVTIENAAHVPWIEAPARVFGSIKTFLDGTGEGAVTCGKHHMTRKTKPLPTTNRAQSTLR